MSQWAEISHMHSVDGVANPASRSASFAVAHGGDELLFETAMCEIARIGGDRAECSEAR